MCQSIGLGVLAFMPHTSLIALYILAVAGGIFLSLDNPLRRSFVSEMVPEADVSNAVVMYSTIVNLSRIFGPLLAGLLIVTAGYGWCFTLDAASYLAVLGCLALMRKKELHRNSLPLRSKGEIRAGLNYVLSQPVLWISFAMLTVIGILTYNFSVTLPLFVTDGLHKSNTAYTIIYSVMSAGSVITALFVAHLKLIQLRFAIIGAMALGISLLVLAVSPDVLIAYIISFFVGAASILYTNSTTALVQLEAKPNMRGRVLALQSVLLIGTTPLGSPLLGWMADNLGGRVPLILGGIASMAAALIGFSMSRIFFQANDSGSAHYSTQNLPNE